MYGTTVSLGVPGYHGTFSSRGIYTCAIYRISLDFTLTLLKSLESGCSSPPWSAVVRRGPPWSAAVRRALFVSKVRKRNRARAFITRCYNCVTGTRLCYRYQVVGNRVELLELYIGISL